MEKGLKCILIDCWISEYEEFKGNLNGFQVYRYEPTPEELQTHKDGGVAIIDQWIACHAR